MVTGKSPLWGGTTTTGPLILQAIGTIVGGSIAVTLTSQYSDRSRCGYTCVCRQPGKLEHTQRSGSSERMTDGNFGQISDACRTSGGVIVHRAEHNAIVNDAAAKSAPAVRT